MLLFSAHPRFARVHLVSHRAANCPVPPAFCTAARKHLEGGVIRDIRQHGFDRILELTVTKKSEAGESVETALVAELMGKHSNLILVSPTGNIIDAAKRITHQINRLREILPGVKYRMPPEQEGRIDPFQPEAIDRFLAETGRLETNTPEADTADPLRKDLQSTIAGMSPYLAAEIASRTCVEASARPMPVRLRNAWEEIFGATQRSAYIPTQILGRTGPIGAYPFPTMQAPSARQQAASSLSSALDVGFSHQIEQAEFDSRAGDLKHALARAEQQMERQRHSLNRTLQESARALEHKHAGELLLANLWRIAPGNTAVTVEDYFASDPSERTITLDAKLSPHQNAEAYFRRFQKARDSEKIARSRLEETEKRLVELEVARRKGEAASDVAKLEAIRADAIARGLVREAREPDEAAEARPDFHGHKIRRFTTSEGYEIFVGETATANDYLTTRLTAPNDLWLHVRGVTSAHVVIRTGGKPEAVPRSVLEEAARICARHSIQKHSSLVAVDYTLKKHVRKPRKAPPGSVQIQFEKTLEVTP